MKNVLLLTIVTVLALNLSVSGQNKSFDDLTLKVTALKNQILRMEPVPIKLGLTNNTDSTITVSSCLTIVGGAVKLEIRKPNGKIVTPAQLSNLNGRMFCSLLPKELVAGESIENSELYSFEHYKYFEKAGEYQVRASFRNNDGKIVRSDWANLSVAEPVAMEKDAYEYLVKKSEKSPNSFRPFSSWSPEEMEEFVLLHPGTAYADYVRYDLACNYQEREKLKAESHLRQIQNKEFVFARDVSERLTKIENEKDQAREH